jgi:hypothetical protein
MEPEKVMGENRVNKTFEMVVKMNQYEERILIQGHTNPSIKEKL